MSQRGGRGKCGWKLGKIAHNIRNINKDNYYKDIKQQLLAFGLSFLDYRSKLHHFLRFSVYKKIFGDLWVPFRYNIPHDDNKHFSNSLRGLPLDTIVRSIRHYNHYQTERERLKSMGFSFEVKIETRFQLIKQAIVAYQSLHGAWLQHSNFSKLCDSFN